MCTYTGKCSDLVNAYYAVKTARDKIKVENSKLYNSLLPVLEELEVFMKSAIGHFEMIYGKQDNLQKSMNMDEIKFEAWYDSNKFVYEGPKSLAKAAYFKNLNKEG